MNRRTFALSAAVALVATPQLATAESQGIKIRFVIARTVSLADGGADRSTYENAVLLAPEERFERDLEGYRVGLVAVPDGANVRVQVVLRDLQRSASQPLTGSTVVKLGQGGGIDFPAQDKALYSVGLLVTPQMLPRNGVA